MPVERWKTGKDKLRALDKSETLAEKLYQDASGFLMQEVANSNAQRSGVKEYERIHKRHQNKSHFYCTNPDACSEHRDIRLPCMGRLW